MKTLKQYNTFKIETIDINNNSSFTGIIKGYQNALLLQSELKQANNTNTYYIKTIE